MNQDYKSKSILKAVPAFIAGMIIVYSGLELLSLEYKRKENLKSTTNIATNSQIFGRDAAGTNYISDFFNSLGEISHSSPNYDVNTGMAPGNMKLYMDKIPQKSRNTNYPATNAHTPF